MDFETLIKEQVAKEFSEQLLNLSIKEILPIKKTVEELKKTVQAKKLGCSVNEDCSLGSRCELEILRKEARPIVGPMGPMNEIVPPITQEDYRPTEEQLVKINKIAKVTQSPTSGYMFSFQATNLGNHVDRSKQRFADTALSMMANRAVANKIPFLLASQSDCEDHTWKAINSMGYVVDAYVKHGGLFYDVYVPEARSTQDILERMFNSQINKLSVGFSMDYRDVMCDSCKTKSIIDENCSHQPGDVDEYGNMVTMTITKILDNYEISAVAVPCQAEANISGNAKSVNVKSIKYIAPTGLVNGYLQTLTTSPAINVKESTQENLLETVDKILNDKITIKDNNLMDKKEEVTIMAEEQLCKVADKVKTQAVAEIKELLEANKVSLDLSEVTSALSEIKSEVEQLLKVKKQMKKLAKQVKKLDLQVKDAKGVPGSPAVLDAALATSPEATSVNLDRLAEETSANLFAPLS